MITFFDVETEDTKQEKKRNPSPYLPTNRLVSVGCAGVIGLVQYRFFNHKEYINPKDARLNFDAIQDILDNTDEFVAFNAKFDLAWFLEAGFKYEGEIYDPMIVEYILARGRKLDMSLAAAAERRKLKTKKSTIIQDYWDAGLTFYEMPLEVVQEYGIDDVQVLRELYFSQQEELKRVENRGLMATIKMSNEFIKCLIDMERNGIHIDDKALDEVEKEFTEEYDKLDKELNALAASALGNTPFNLDSPEQLSQLIYSRKVLDKKRWATTFNIGTELRGAVMKPKRRPRMSTSEFVQNVRDNTTVIKRTVASHCTVCSQSGLVHRKRRDGTDFKRISKCSNCGGRGFTLENLPQVAGFKCTPTGPEDVSAGGFGTDGDSIERLAKTATGAAKEFLSKISRYNAIGTYLDTFVAGIRRGRGQDGLLHTQLMQAITATGRLSSQQPNFQNMPRAGTFPVRRVVKSRWNEGEILEVDFAKLEYVAAVFLAQDQIGIKDILAGVDAHTLTAQIITDAGQPLTRQDAKSRTFRPLYGGHSGTPAEVAYNIWFKEKHKGITEWQERNKITVLTTGKYSIPSGREYMFFGTKRLPNGYITNSTQICNYGVQGFATADIVPCTIIELRRLLRLTKLRSLIILTVHDSIVFDVYPGEQDQISSLINEAFSNIPRILKERYGIILNVPLGWESKAGTNWLNMKAIYVDDGKKSLTA